MAHTPGPWAVGGQSGNQGEAEVITAVGRTIAWTADTYDEDDDAGHITAEDRANARLIAAAPELLAALKNLRNFVEDNLFFGEEAVMADRAIAKAEGRTE